MGHIPFNKTTSLSNLDSNSFLNAISLGNLFYTRPQVDALVGGGGGGGTTTLDYKLVSNVADLRTAITNATDYTTIALMSGVYDLTGSPLEIQNKTGLTIRAGGNATITSSTLTENVVIRGGVVDLNIIGIRFTSTLTGATGYGMILVNEQGNITNFTIDSCYFSNAASGRNAITMSANSGNTTATYKNITIQNCRFINIGRMGIEILNHAWNNAGAPQIWTSGVFVKNNIFENLGVNDTSHGMAVSVSGLNEQVHITGNHTYEGKFCCYELVGSRDSICSFNTAKNVTNTAAGISISDNGKGATTRISVVGNVINTIGRGIQAYDSTWLQINNNEFISTKINDIRSNTSQFCNNQMKVTADTGCLYMEHALYCVVTNNHMSTVGSTVQTYGVINLFVGSNPCRKNVVDKNFLFRPTNALQTVIEGSTTDNYIGTNYEEKL
jgi:hypothetical protein